MGCNDHRKQTREDDVPAEIWKGLLCRRMVKEKRAPKGNNMSKQGRGVKMTPKDKWADPSKEVMWRVRKVLVAARKENRPPVQFQWECGVEITQIQRKAKV